ncbi:ice nucleation protein [Plakobranchus ocellatus]|uniref:Ice nucleation protein n=1 Tax=Plakobranchus ocellatus TaxID=259542 RepID=A0AAV4C086_9GAST|nr:ice nucleation protein [Plakobranchus ocellatus]
MEVTKVNTVSNEKGQVGGYHAAEVSASSAFPADSIGSVGPSEHTGYSNAAFDASRTENKAPTAPPAYESIARPAYQSFAPPGFQSTMSPGVQSTAPPGFQSTAPPGFQSTMSPGVQSTAPPGFQSTVPAGFQSNLSPGVQSTAPPGFQSTVPPGFQSTTPPGFQSTAPLGSQSIVLIAQSPQHVGGRHPAHSSPPVVVQPGAVVISSQGPLAPREPYQHVPNYLWLGILSLLFCLCIGIASIVLAYKANNLKYEFKYQQARSKANAARNLALIGIVIGAILTVVTFVGNGN